MIYRTGLDYYFYSNDDTQSDQLLPVLSQYYRNEYLLQTIGNSPLIYARLSWTEEGEIAPAVVGLLNDDLNERELAKFPGIVFMDQINADLDLKVITAGVSSHGVFNYGEEVFIYDREADCFSKLSLQTKYEGVVYLTVHEDELIILTYSGRDNFCMGMTLYTITKK